MIKGQLLPKALRVKGKSKFMYARLREEGIAYNVDRWIGEIPMLNEKKGIPRNPLTLLYNKYGLC